jgi:hypothetical protein
MASDYIPHSYAAFRAWARNFLQTAEENKTEWGLPDAPLAALRAAYEDYELIDDNASGAEATSSRRIRRKEALGDIPDLTFCKFNYSIENHTKWRNLWLYQLFK